MYHFIILVSIGGYRGGPSPLENHKWLYRGEYKGKILNKISSLNSYPLSSGVNHGPNCCSYNAIRFQLSPSIFKTVYTDHLEALLSRMQFYIFFLFSSVDISHKSLNLDQGIVAYKVIVFRMNRTCFFHAADPCIFF